MNGAILHLADLHLDEQHDLDGTVRILDQALEAADVPLDLVLVAGDLFHRRSTPVEREALADWLTRAAKRAPVLMVRGNHDQLGDLLIYRRLRTRNPVLVHEVGFTVQEIPESRISVLAVPWFDRQHVVAAATADQDVDLLTRRAVQALEDWIAHEAQALALKGRIPVVAGHLMRSGASCSNGQVLCGTPLEVGALAAPAVRYVALGHIHRHQGWVGGGPVDDPSGEWVEAPEVYAGSPRRVSFGEPEPKGMVLVSFYQPSLEQPLTGVEFIELPNPQLLRLVRDARDLEAWDPAQLVERGARVRVRIQADAEAPPDPEALDRLRRKLARAGAAEIRVEVVAERRTVTRDPEIHAARTTWEKLERWLRTQGLEDTGRLRGLLDEVENEVGP